MLMGAKWLCAYWLVIDFSQQGIEKAREKNFFSDFFALEVFYVKTMAKMLKISAGLL